MQFLFVILLFVGMFLWMIVLLKNPGDFLRAERAARTSLAVRRRARQFRQAQEPDDSFDKEH